MVTLNSQDPDRQIKFVKDNVIGDKDNQTHISSPARKKFKNIKSTLWPSNKYQLYPVHGDKPNDGACSACK